MQLLIPSELTQSPLSLSSEISPLSVDGGDGELHSWVTVEKLRKAVSGDLPARVERLEPLTDIRPISRTVGDCRSFERSRLDDCCSHGELCSSDPSLAFEFPRFGLGLTI